MMKPSEVVAGAAGIVLFAGAVLAMAPELQLNGEAPPEQLMPYTPTELHGRKTYVDLGCVYCHSQQPRDKRQAPDGERGWGRASTPGDYAYDSPQLTGTMRTGPDLLNIGVRQSNDVWHLLHLYQPRAVVPGSIMPSYPFLFREVKRSDLKPHDRIIDVPAPWAPPDTETVVVATDDALDLVAYLKGLKRNFHTTELPQLAAPEANTDAAAKQVTP